MNTEKAVAQLGWLQEFIALKGSWGRTNKCALRKLTEELSLQKSSSNRKSELAGWKEKELEKKKKKEKKLKV